jgi:PleD family two-component response regulator
MGKDGAIIIIEDDMDDQELMADTFRVLNFPNEVVFFSNGHDALDYISQVKRRPLLIISDINMPKIDGFQIKKELNSISPLSASIPYIFFSTSAQAASVINAFAVSAHGYFIKPHSAAIFRDTIRTIVNYWQQSCPAA